MPSEKRPALVERFRDDPACRVFLSTDAGSTGLNLQYASTLVNMDLPWNPAILEQRISRIHRMGQKRAVQIVNFVAKGTIEEGMLTVLAFKRSLSAGILDGASGEIFFGGSRLNRFMKDVENVTGHMGEGESVLPAEEMTNVVAAEAMPEQGGQVDEQVGSPEALTTVSAGETPPVAPQESAHSVTSDPWDALLQVGTRFVTALAASGDTPGPAHPWIERDPASGARSLKVPLPPPETAKRIADTLLLLAEALRGKQSGK